MSAPPSVHRGRARRWIRFAALVVVVLVAAAGGVFTRLLINRHEQQRAGQQQDLRIRPPAPSEPTGSVDVHAGWYVPAPGQRSFQAVFPNRRPDEIRPPVMPSCGFLMAWAHQQGGIVLGAANLSVSISANEDFRVEGLRPSVISRDQTTGAFLECYFIRYDNDNHYPAVGLDVTDIPPELGDRNSFYDEQTGISLWSNQFRLDPGECANCAYELLARLRTHDGRVRELAITGPDGGPLRVGADQPHRVPDLTWCEERTAEDVDGDDLPETRTRETDSYTVTTTDTCGDTPLRG